MGILGVGAWDAWLHLARPSGGSRVHRQSRARQKRGRDLVAGVRGALAWPLPMPYRNVEAERRGAEAANRAGGSARSVATWRGKVSKRGRYHVGSRQQWLSGKTG